VPEAHGVGVPRRTSTNVWATAVPTADASGYEQIGRAEQGADAHRVKVTFSTPYADNAARVAHNSVSQDIARLGTHPGADLSEAAALASGKRGRQRVLGEGDREDGNSRPRDRNWSRRILLPDLLTPADAASHASLHRQM
jgi:hypothetical protein